MFGQIDEYYMRIALAEAAEAYEAGEIPIGAVITVNGKIIARAHNRTEALNDVTAHAEMQAITSAAEYHDMSVVGPFSAFPQASVTIAYNLREVSQPPGIIIFYFLGRHEFSSESERVSKRYAEKRPFYSVSKVH